MYPTVDGKMKRVTLTFDNGPTGEVTPRVLDALGEKGMSARFCVVGTQLMREGGVDLALRVLNEGHQLVNHSLTHGTALGDDPSDEHASREITEMHNLMAESVGEWGQPWFRPFGRGGYLGSHIFSTAALAQLMHLRYSVLLWNSVPRDWEDTSGWVETALRDISRTEHTVVVLHDLPTGAMANLPRFLDELAARDIVVTHDLPEACVPLLRGQPTYDLTGLTRA